MSKSIFEFQVSNGKRFDVHLEEITVKNNNELEQLRAKLKKQYKAREIFFKFKEN